MNIKDQIRAEIERRHTYQKEMYNKTKPDGRPNDGWAESLAIMGELEELRTFLETLPEQPVEKTCKTCGFYENNCPFIRDKFIPYPNKVCKDYTYSVMKAQEQPVEGLEEEISRTYHDGSVANTDNMDHNDYENIARHFADWGAEHAKK